MPNGQTISERTAQFLSKSSNGLPVDPSDDAGLLGPDDSLADQPNRFVMFLPDHEARALRLAERFMSIANEQPGLAGLEAVLDAAEEAATDRSAELVKHALMVFITHHPQGRALPIPPLDQRAPERVVPSHPADDEGLLGALGEEAKLDYYREDTAVNDHHERWHIVYPGSGHPDPANPAQRIMKDRQGELFWYMHQQMLARYDTERLALGLPAVQPFESYRDPIAEGYDANVALFSDRPANQRLTDLPQYNYMIADHETVRTRLMRAVQQGFFERSDGSKVPITAPLLGSTIEATDGSVDSAVYGQLHNMGHVLIAAVPDPETMGMMSLTSTAVRDPVFFRWHRHVDDVFVEWQESLGAQDILAEAPPVRLRRALDGSRAAHASPDILLCSERTLPKLADREFKGQEFGEATFGGAAWNAPLTSITTLTNELQTSLRSQTLRMPNGSTETKPYLDHEEFCYFIRMENTGAGKRKVTVRIFLAAEEVADNRRMWIEMDKFTHELAGRQRSVVYRPARLSAVVRKPARRPTDPKPRRPGPAQDAEYCDCGWPYHLLLPRGTPAGMACRLCVVLTSFESDLVGADKKCGSMSFCGAKDAKYPDRRPMGYPFDRPFAGSMEAMIANADHIATRALTIRFMGDRGPNA